MCAIYWLVQWFIDYHRGCMYKTLHLLLKKLQVDRENTVYFTIQTQHTILQSFFLNILQQIGFLILTHQGENVDFVGVFSPRILTLMCKRTCSTFFFVNSDRVPAVWLFSPRCKWKFRSKHPCPWDNKLEFMSKLVNHLCHQSWTIYNNNWIHKLFQ